MAASITVEELSKRYLLGQTRVRAPRIRHLLPRRSGRGRPARDQRSERREILALREISFSVEPGTILGVIGPNGAGKSTLLKVLSRVTSPTSGRAIVTGRVVSLLELGAGFHTDFSGRHNVYLNAAMYGIPEAEVDKRFERIVEFAELEEFIDTPIKRYSSGMYLRLAFSVAINMEPDILLADEVLAVGDAQFRERSLERVGEAGEAGLTVLFVSHDMAAVRRLCNRVIWLNAGEIVADGTPGEVVEAYQSKAWTQLAARGAESGSDVNEHAAILDVRLLSIDGDELEGVRVSDELRLQVRFRVDTPEIAFRALFAVRAEGVDVFRTVQPEEVPAPEPGVYSATVRIPAHLLADIVYSVKVSVKLSVDGERTRVMRETALSFRAYDPGGSESARGDWEGGLNGVVRPRLDWEVDRPAAPAEALPAAASPERS